jgi:3-hydroxyisobutyrate dehydrogenase-like beta-hydroxyacid dehydrogenase
VCDKRRRRRRRALSWPIAVKGWASRNSSARAAVVIIGSVRVDRNVNVGFVGLGRMGMPMCARLVRSGFPVRASDLRLTLRQELEATGARWEPTAAVVARNVEVLVTMLPGAHEVSEVAADVSGVLAPGAIWIDMSTGSPQSAADVAAAAARRGIRVVDAPVAGGPDDARAGRLLAFVGADSSDLARVGGVLAAIADRVVHVGPHGSGYLAKLMANSLWFCQAVAVAEVLTLARRAGLDLDVVREAIGQSAAASQFIAVDADALLAGDDHASFSLARCCEQLSTMLELGARLNVPLDAVALANDVHRRALARYGDVDGELLGARLIAEEAGVELRRI